MPMAIAYLELKSEVGHFLGYGATEGNWDATQAADVERCVQMGLRQFYGARAWNFLQIIAQLNTVVGDYLYVLPTTVSTIQGDLAYPLEGQSRIIRMVGNVRWKEMSNHDPDRSGPPTTATIRQLLIDNTPPQKQVLVLWPKPDAIYNIEYLYTLAPNKLATATDTPYGADVHSMVILQSMLAYAEGRLGDSQGVQAAKYERMLIDAIRLDAETRRANWHGYNADRSERSLFTPSRVSGLVTVQGQEPE
jgi:hypothetical protein